MLDDSTALALVHDEASEPPSRRQLANKANAQLSTGPRTELGRQRVASNALSHGLTAKRMVLPLESHSEFDDLVEQLWTALQPVGALEEVLAERAISCFWRLRRASRIELEILSWACGGPARRGVQVPVGQELGWSFTSNNDGGHERVLVLEQKIERSMYRALDELKRLQAVRAGKPAPPTATFDVEVSIDVIAGQTSGFDFQEPVARGDRDPKTAAP